MDSITWGFILTLLLSVIVLLIVLILFHFLRRKFPNIFDYRRTLEPRKDLLDCNGEHIKAAPPPGPGFFDWAKEAIKYDDEKMIQTHGLDMVSYLQIQKTLCKIFVICSLVTMVILFPVYGTGGNNNLSTDDPLYATGIMVITMANLPSRSHRYWATAIVDAILVAVCVFYLDKLYRTFTQLRIAYRKKNWPTSYAVVCMDMPPDFVSEDIVRDYFERMFPGKIIGVQFVLDGKHILELKEEYMKAVDKRESLEYKLFTPKGQKQGRPQHRPALCGACRGVELVDSIEYWQSEQDRLAAEIAQLQAEPEKLEARSAAIVVFNSKQVASIATQLQIGPQTTLFSRDFAGEPVTVNWPRLSMKVSIAPVFSGISWLMEAFFIIFWGAVIAAAMGLANLTALSQTSAFSWLKPVLSWPPSIVGLIEQLLPVVVIIVLNLIPTMVMEFLAGLERFHSKNLTEVQFQLYVYLFLLFAVFIYPVIGTAALNDIQEIITDPSQIPKILANSVPKGAIFFINYLLLQGFITNGLNLIQIARVVVQPILGLIWKTERGRRKIRDFGSEMKFPKPFGTSALIFMIGIGYSSIAPLICIFATTYFGVQYIIMRFLLVYSMNRPFEGGGMLFLGTIQQILFSLFFKCAVMTSVIGLDRSAAASIEGVLMFIVIVAFVWLRRKYDKVIWFGDFEQTSKNPDNLELVQSYLSKYRNPALQPLPPYVNLNGVDGVVGDDLDDDLEDVRKDSVAKENPEQVSEELTEDKTNLDGNREQDLDWHKAFHLEEAGQNYLVDGAKVDATEEKKDV